MLPPLGMLDELISQSLGAGFAFITIGIMIGSIWAFVEIGTRWIGDSSIAISFVTWAVYLRLVFFRVKRGMARTQDRDPLHRRPRLLPHHMVRPCPPADSLIQ